LQKIFIGDVQGCADELDALIERVQRSFGDALELWIVGDVVNRGPSSLRALRTVRDLVEAGIARFVLGNHEVGLVATALGLREPSHWDTFEDVLQARDADAWIDWLLRRPLVETGQLGSQPFAMVHAASHPDWSLSELCGRARSVEARLAADPTELRRFLATPEHEDPDRDTLGRLTRCRSVSRDGRWSSELPAGEFAAWHVEWSRRSHDYGIVYGHWALQGLHVAPGLRGLDTGCVHHGRGRDGALTAWLPDPSAQTPFDVPDDRFWQEAARRAYYAHRDASV
jgi:bis(5'-nucleosyl)-tetraphosphatase (symmetrical)